MPPPEDPTRTLPPVVVEGVEPDDRETFVVNLPLFVSPPPAYQKEYAEIEPDDPRSDPCIAALVNAIVNSAYPDGIGEEGMQALRALAKAQAPTLFDSSHTNPSGFVEYAAYLTRKADGSLEASGPLTSGSSDGVNVSAANNYLSGLAAGDTIVGVIHTHKPNSTGRGGIASPGDTEFETEVRQRLNDFPTLLPSMDENPVVYVIDQNNVVREYNSEQLSNITGTDTDRFGARVNNDGTIDVSSDC
ncbi:hypothetical protein [Henriciella sp.]|uniref:hypothetical protein n=1 Tax=Henriciella sp. TaxID=1968823 RepID=UPI00262FE5CD|nr:hypothetical protein [Henriciella sp.]